MKKLVICGILFLVAALSFAEDAGENLIRRIYKDHQPAKDISILESRENLSKYFDGEMTDLFLKDAECSRRTGEICNLDYDPIYSGQDFSGEDPKLQVKKLTGTKDTETFLVTFVNFSPVKLTYQVRLTSQGWRVSDIVDEEGHSLKKLLSQKVP